MSDDKDNVIPFAPRPGRFRLLSGRKDGPICFHEHALVDRLNRAVWCADCNATLDPIEELAKIARDVDWVVAMRREKAGLEVETERLKHERDALKLSVSGLKKRRGVRP